MAFILFLSLLLVLACVGGGIVIPLLAMRWTVANLFRLCGVRDPERTHGRVLSLLAVPAAGGYLVWFLCELVRWVHR